MCCTIYRDRGERELRIGLVYQGDLEVTTNV